MQYGSWILFFKTRYYLTVGRRPARQQQGAHETITCCKKTADEPVRSEVQRFKLALKNSPVIVFDLDRQLRYTWVYNPNPKFGYTADQIIGKTDAELLSLEKAGR